VKRRQFITLLGGAAAWPLAARAQQRERARRVGVIMGFAEDDGVWQSYLATFRQRLQDFGWTEGHNIHFDYRFTGESTERMRIAATEVVAMGPDVIFVTTNPVVSAVKEVTRTIPIVFTWVSDSVGSGYVTSLAHPGGNITGFHNYEPVLGAKWMGILKEIAPAVRRVGFVHVPEITANVAFMRVGEASSAALGMTVSGAGVRNAVDIERVLTEFAQEPNGGLIVTPSPLTATRRALIIDLAARLRLPTIYSFRFYAASGGLISYGIDQTELVREAASYVDRILRGANPAELPVQLPTKYQLVINLKTANALGLNVPQFDAIARRRGDRVKRREFITLLGGAVAPWPLAARAQQPMIPVIGMLSPRASGDVPQLIAAVRQGLKESGYVEGQNVTIEYRFAENQNERLAALAADLVHRQVTVIVATAAPAAVAAKAATTNIPIIFPYGSDLLPASIDRAAT